MKKNPHAVALGKRGGKATTERKAAASRKNGKKGGRPRNACEHCGFDIRVGQHGVIGPADKPSAVIVSCAVPQDAEPLTCVFVRRPFIPHTDLGKRLHALRQQILSSTSLESWEDVERERRS